MFTASEIFDLAIQVEVNGENYYRSALGRVVRGELKDLLGWLADQEVMHRQKFQELKARLCANRKGRDIISGASGTALRAAMGRHAFSLDELEAGSISDEKEILKAAVDFEEDSILFYEFIASLVTDAEALSTLALIREQEMEHRKLLMKMSNP